MITHEKMILFDLDGTLWDSAENVAESWNDVLERRKVTVRRPSLMSEAEMNSLIGPKSRPDTGKAAHADGDIPAAEARGDGDSGDGLTAGDIPAAGTRGRGYRILTGEDIHAVMGKTMSDIADIMFGHLDPGLKSSVADECNKYEVDYISENGGVLFRGVRETIEVLHRKGIAMGIVSNCQSGYIGAFLKSMDMTEYFADTEEWGNTFKSKGENIRLLMERNGCKEAFYVGDTSGDERAARAAGIPFVHAAYGFGSAESPDAVITEFPEILQLV